MTIQKMRDYDNGFSTGIYYSFLADAGFWYLNFQIRGVGQISFGGNK